MTKMNHTLNYIPWNGCSDCSVTDTLETLEAVKYMTYAKNAETVICKSLNESSGLLPGSTTSSDVREKQTDAAGARELTIPGRGHFETERVEKLVPLLLGISERLKGRQMENTYLAACWLHGSISNPGYKYLEHSVALPEPEVTEGDITDQIKHICREVNDSVMPMTSRPYMEQCLILLQEVLYIMNKSTDNGNK